MEELISIFGRALAHTMRDTLHVTTLNEVLNTSDSSLRRVYRFGKIALDKVHRLRKEQPVAITLPAKVITMAQYDELKRRVDEAHIIISSFLLQDHPKISKYSRERMEYWVEGKSIWTKTPIGKPKGI